MCQACNAASGGGNAVALQKLLKQLQNSPTNQAPPQGVPQQSFPGFNLGGS